ncbi:BTAD domain-containing putative transcriptional regulator [Streptomyces sp900105245]|uniref:BTAD domain-containing putative transcriptional regulator n=1 Tax=Streptomyces sp. 900105245 TaxID=3154379 RepID=A0ABV1UJ60_9ACTN
MDATLAETLIKRRVPDHAAATVSALRPALALWRGDSLADVTVLPWFNKQAERLESMRVEAECTLMSAHLELGEHVQILPELERAVARNPYREQFHRLLMLALYRAGRQADALEVYHRLRWLLDEDLGISPSPGLRSLEEAILRQDVSLEAPVAVGARPLASRPSAAPGSLPSEPNHTLSHPHGTMLIQGIPSPGRAATAVRASGAAVHQICRESTAEHSKVSDLAPSASPTPKDAQDTMEPGAPSPLHVLDDARPDKTQAAARTWNDLLEAAYRSVTETGRWDDGQPQPAPFGTTKTDEVLARLTQLHLIEPASGESGTWRPVSPNVAMARAVAPLEEEARDRARQAESVRRQIEMMLPVYQEQLRNKPQHGIEVISDEGVLRDLLSHEMASCASLLVAQATADPSGPGRAQFLEAAANGAQVRGLFQHSNRYNQPSLGLFEEATALGASLKTVDDIPVDVMVFDRSACFILLQPSAEGVEGKSLDRPNALAVVIRHHLVVSLAVDVYEKTWASAAQFDTANSQPIHITDEIRRSILRLLAIGCKDEHVARHVGISVRTCRRHIAAILSELGATSRFQAGARAQELGLL